MLQILVLSHFPSQQMIPSAWKMLQKIPLKIMAVTAGRGYSCRHQA
jgi:hypothetical protein